MRRLEKEILRLEDEGKIGAAFVLAKAAGYFVFVSDGDVENGMSKPELFFDRAGPDHWQGLYKGCFEAAI